MPIKQVNQIRKVLLLNNCDPTRQGKLCWYRNQMSKKQGEVFGPRIRKKWWRIFGSTFHLSPNLIPAESGHLSLTHVGSANSLWPSSQIIPNPQKVGCKIQHISYLWWKTICQEIWSPKRSCGLEMRRKGKRTPRWCARGEEKLAHLPIDGAEFRTRTIFDDASVMRKWAGIKSWRRHNKQDTPFCRMVPSFCSAICCLNPGLSYGQN